MNEKNSVDPKTGRLWVQSPGKVKPGIIKKKKKNSALAVQGWTWRLKTSPPPPQQHAEDTFRHVAGRDDRLRLETIRVQDLTQSL